MFSTSVLFLAAGNFLAAANPGAPVLGHERYAFCHDPSYPLSGKDWRWCAIIGDSNAVCPSLPAACAKPPEPVDIDITLGGGSGGDGDGGADGSGDGGTGANDDHDGDSEGQAWRGEVRVHVKPGDGSGSGNGSGSGSGNGSGNGNGTGSGNGNGNGSISGDIGNGSGNGNGSGSGSGNGNGSGSTAGNGTSPSGGPANKPPASKKTPENKPPPPPAPPPPPPPPPSAGLSVLAQVLLFALIGVGVGLLARALAKHLSWGKKKTDDELDPGEQAATAAENVVVEKRGPVETDVERLLARAQAAAQRGDFARAVEDAYAALLRRLDGAGLIELHPSRTNGDYVRALHERPELRSNVRAIVRDVENVQFGATAPSLQVFRLVFDRVVPIATRALGVLALLFAAATLTSCDPKPGSTEPSGDTGPYGTAALEELLDGRGREVSHRTLPLLRIEDEDHDKTLVLLRGAELDEETWREVVDWTSEGGTLVVAGLRHLPPALSAEPTNDESKEPKLERSGAYEYGYGYAGLDVLAPPGTALRTSATSEAWVLARGDRPYAIGTTLGKGRVFVFAERALFTNIAFTAGDNAAFVSTFLYDLGHDVELCDIWTGAGAGSPLDSMRKARLTPVIAQLLVLALLFLVWRGAHFGLPRDPAAKTRRAFADHVRALGHIYERARASEHALGNFSAWAIERLRERFYRGTRSGLSPLAEAIAARTGRSEGEVLQVLVEAQSARETAGPPSSFRSDHRPGARLPGRGASEEKDLQMIRTLFDFLRVNATKAPGNRANNTP